MKSVPHIYGEATLVFRISAGVALFPHTKLSGNHRDLMLMVKAIIEEGYSETTFGWSLYKRCFVRYCWCYPDYNCIINCDIYCVMWFHLFRAVLTQTLIVHDDVIKWKHFLRYWPFVQGIHRSPENSPNKGQWRGVLMFSLICTWINGWVNSGEAGDLRHHRAYYDVTVMCFSKEETRPDPRPLLLVSR